MDSGWLYRGAKILDSLEGGPASFCDTYIHGMLKATLFDFAVDAIRLRLEDTDLGVPQLAEKLGVSRKTPYKWFSRKNPLDLKNYLASLLFLNVPIPLVDLETDNVAFVAAIEIVKRIKSEALEEECEELEPAHFAVVHYFCNHVDSLKASEIPGAKGTREIARVMDDVLVRVRDTFPKSTVDYQFGKEIIGRWIESYLAFYKALTIVNWDLFNVK